MGQYVSAFKANDANQASEKTHPSKDNWITLHAAITGLAIVEVERLWKRFVKLGCDKDGILRAAVLSRPPASEDIFVKNVLITFRSHDGDIRFQTFCNAMKFAETSTDEIKMRAIFHMLGNGQKVSQDILSKALRRVYESFPQEKIDSIASTFMTTMDPNKTGSIVEDEWVKWGKRLPKEELRELLKFVIIPEEVNEEAHRSFTSMAYSTQPGRETRLLPPRQNQAPVTQPKVGSVPSDELLVEVARKVMKYDWVILGNKMGYTAEQLKGLGQKYPGDTFNQVFSLLKTWRHREAEKATSDVLEQFLRACRMNDAAMLLI